ncbi:hypothetical protein JTE90_007322 [Oedothorax gibbosus]|uniref:Uncharacterized protein n=1 Tax=Oedothorax gibbosus TaxID=931172 RepID=A0AAV6UPT0_9ARAC|nr:hypothetical protein JTE90_007322 [Oedothorax gibbosus]
MILVFGKSVTVPGLNNWLLEFVTNFSATYFHGSPTPLFGLKYKSKRTTLTMSLAKGHALFARGASSTHHPTCSWICRSPNSSEQEVS